MVRKPGHARILPKPDLVTPRQGSEQPPTQDPRRAVADMKEALVSKGPCTPAPDGLLVLILSSSQVRWYGSSTPRSPIFRRKTTS